jgi:hypothetical protein
MKLTLQRRAFDSAGTPGQLSVNGRSFCFTLERAKDDAVHPCIPAGVYRILLQNSPHFGRLMPHLQDIPGRTDILIHWGNYVMDSEGCILVGIDPAMKGMAGYFLGLSRAAFDDLWKQLEPAQEAGIEIEVINAPTEAQS